MAFDGNEPNHRRLLPRTLKDLLMGWVARLGGLLMLIVAGLLWLSLLTWSAGDPSFSTSINTQPQNLLGTFGATVSDLLLQTVGLSVVLILTCMVVWAGQLIVSQHIDRIQVRGFYAAIAACAIAGGLSALPASASWKFLHGYGGLLGDLSFNLLSGLLNQLIGAASAVFAGAGLFAAGSWAFCAAVGLDRERIAVIFTPPRSRAENGARHHPRSAATNQPQPVDAVHPDAERQRVEPSFNLSNLNPAQARLVAFGKVGAQHPMDGEPAALDRRALSERPAYDSFEARLDAEAEAEAAIDEPGRSAEDIALRFAPGAVRSKAGAHQAGLQQRSEAVKPAAAADDPEMVLPSFLGHNARPRPGAYQGSSLTKLLTGRHAVDSSDQRNDERAQTAAQLTAVLADFRVKGEIKDIRPGPVVTLYEFEPARGTKSSRVIALAEDVARSMSAKSARISVIPGRNAIGIELPNGERETVLLRQLLESDAYRQCDARLPLALGKGIGGEPVIADLARMPHLLVAGTTGSGKSVGINAMVLSLLYRKSPDDCRLLMIDPKMLELSSYNGIPHLLAPVITDPHRAVLALHWAVSEMEQRYKRMSELGARSIEVFNNRVRHAKRTGDRLVQRVHVGFSGQTGEALFEDKVLDLATMPYIVIIVDEFADLMSVAGKDIEAAIQRLAQMARAAGMHLVMATQRPSVDVVTGTIKANFPTRIGFKVASKIDSRTILNEHGAELLLGQGDMLLASGAGAMVRAHGPFVSDAEVEAVSSALRAQGAPGYDAGLCALLETTDEPGTVAARPPARDLYAQAVAIVRRDGRASTSYLQRRLSIGYNRAADLIERMENDGLISPADSAGKREIVA